MGTSKAYSSPKWPGVNHAVGDTVSASDPTGKGILTAVGIFATAYKDYLKSNVETIDGGGQGQSSSRSYSGPGSTTKKRSASSGARLAHFINTAGKSGFEAALKEFDMSDFRDKPLNEFLDSLTERLSGNGGLLDDNALNRAMAETLDELAQTIDSVDDFDALLKEGNIDIEEILQIYFANILAANFEQKEYGFVREKISRENTDAFFVRAHEVIRAIVRDELSKERDLSKVNWNSAEGRQIADAINSEVLDILIP